MQMKNSDFLKMAVTAAEIAESKKALDTVVLDVRDLTAIANYFVIATAESTPQINAICSEIEKTFKDEGVVPVRREGISSASWRVIDYGWLVVHVMSPQVRELYKLEKLWDGAKSVKVNKASVLQISVAEKAEELKAIINERLSDEKKKAAKKIKKIEKKAKTMRKNAQKKAEAVKNKITKKVVKAEKKTDAVKKQLKKKIEKAGKKVKRVKKNIKALGKGVEVFGKTPYGQIREEKIVVRCGF